jgi:NitT/TauT family transport system permease protein
MSRTTLLLLQVLVAAVAIALWYALTTYEIFGVTVLPPFFFSTPVDVADRIVRLFAGGTIWKHLWVTLSESMLAFAIGSIAGVLVGFWFARKHAFAAVFDPYVKMINALPRVVLAPIFTLWFGLGIWSKVALGVTLVFFIVFFNVYQGVKEVSPTVLANARMLGMGERALMRHVYWPSALSWMFSSLHTAVGFAVVGAVVGEYLGSAAGLGYLIQQAEGIFDVAGVFAGMLILAAFVIVIDAGVSIVEKRLLVWRPVVTEGRGVRQAFTAGAYSGTGASLGFLAQLFVELSAFVRFMFHIGVPTAGKFGPHILGEHRNPQAVTAKSARNANDGDQFQLSREQK